MNKLNIIIIITLLLLLLYLYKIYNIYTFTFELDNTRYFKYKYTYLDDIKNTLDTGDIVLFSAYDFSFITIFSSTRFSHIAMIIKLDKDIYCVEMVDGDYITPGTMYNDINIFNLEERILYYSGFVYIAKCNKQLTINDKKNIINTINTYNFKYPNNYNLLLQYLFNIKSNYYKTCISLVIYLMQIGNIYNSEKIKFKNYMYNIILICNGDIYSQPIRILIKNKNNIIDNNNRQNLCILN